MVRTTQPLQTKARLMAWIGCWLLAGLAWIPTIEQAQDMPAIPGTMGLSLVPFLGCWSLMMAAMMLPTFAPQLAWHLEMTPQQGRRPLLAARAGRVLLGYLLVWAACGLPVYGLAAAEGFLLLKAPSLVPEMGALVLVTLGCYQLTPFQAACLASCHRHPGRRPARWLLPAALQDIGTGLAYGITCLGACGGLMLLLVIVGLMNLGWMVAITLVIVLEKGWVHGHHLALLVGVGLLLLGILAAGDPGLLPGGSLLVVP